METEIKNLKFTYEKEISKLRQQVEDISQQRNSLQVLTSKLESTSSDLKNRLLSVSSLANSHRTESFLIIYISIG